MYARGVLLWALIALPVHAADRVPEDSSGPMLYGEFLDTSMEGIELTMRVVRAYQDLLDGDLGKAMRGFRDAALLGHAGAAEALCELTWAQAPEPERFRETSHWADVAHKNGAEVSRLQTLLYRRDAAAVDQYFAEQLAADTPPDYVAKEDGRDPPPEWREGNSWVHQKRPKTTTLQVRSNVYGQVLIDGIIAGSVNEELEIEPGARVVELLVANKPAHRVSVQAVEGRNTRVDLTGYKFKHSH